MTTNHRTASRRRLDAASLVLMLIGLAFGVLSFWLITTAAFSALIIIPSIVAMTLGATHMVKRQAPRPLRCSGLPRGHEPLPETRSTAR